MIRQECDALMQNHCHLVERNFCKLACSLFDQANVPVEFGHDEAKVGEVQDEKPAQRITAAKHKGKMTCNEFIRDSMKI
jgi:hypothetical protein